MCKNFGVLAVVSFFCHRSGQRAGCLTKRAADVWDSARFSSSFLAWVFFCFQVESHPTHTGLTQSVSPVLATWFIRPELSGTRGVSCYFTLIIFRERKMGKILCWLQERVKHWTKPASSVLIIGILSDQTRSHTELVKDWPNFYLNFKKNWRMS